MHLACPAGRAISLGDTDFVSVPTMSGFGAAAADEAGLIRSASAPPQCLAGTCRDLDSGI